MRKRGRLLVIALAILAVVAVVLVVAWPQVLVSIVRWEASRRGYEIDGGTAEGGFGEVRLSDVRVSLRGVRGASATAKTVRVSLSFLSPRRVDVTGVEAALDDADWGALLGHADLHGGITWYVRGANVRAGAARATGIDVDHASTGGRAVIADVALAGRSVRGVTATWTSGGEVTRIDAAGWGTGTVTRQAGSTRFELRTAGFQLARLVPDVGAAARMDGTMTVSVTEQGAASGEAAVTVTGWTPPVSREAASFVGARTDVKTRLSAKPGGALSLDDLKVVNGSLALAGRGTLERTGALRASLDGAVPCARIAGQAAKAALGDVLGGIAGVAVGAAVSGSVEVHLEVSADARSPSASRVVPSFRVACGL